jgi:hypothetical protein
MRSNSSPLQKRLAQLEGVNPTNEIVLHFKDGSTRAFEIRQRSVLELLCAATSLAHWSLHPEAYTPEALAAQRSRTDVPPGSHEHEDVVTGRPTSKFDFLLELLSQATRISGPAAHHLVHEAWCVCRHRIESLRRGEHIYFTRENRDPFFADCEVGPLTGHEPQQLQLSSGESA